MRSTCFPLLLSGRSLPPFPLSASPPPPCVFSFPPKKGDFYIAPLWLKRYSSRRMSDYETVRCKNFLRENLSPGFWYSQLRMMEEGRGFSAEVIFLATSDKSLGRKYWAPCSAAHIIEVSGFPPILIRNMRPGGRVGSGSSQRTNPTQIWKESTVSMT